MSQPVVHATKWVPICIFVSINTVFVEHLFQEELGFYLKCTNLEELDLSEPHSIGYTYKCLGAGFWALKQENFRDTIEAIVRSVSYCFVKHFHAVRSRYKSHFLHG